MEYLMISTYNYTTEDKIPTIEYLKEAYDKSLITHEEAKELMNIQKPSSPFKSPNEIIFLQFESKKYLSASDYLYPRIFVKNKTIKDSVLFYDYKYKNNLKNIGEEVEEQDLEKYLCKYVWVEENGHCSGLHYINKINYTKNYLICTDGCIYTPQQVQLIKQLTKEEVMALEVGAEVIILDEGSMVFGIKSILKEKPRNSSNLGREFIFLSGFPNSDSYPIKPDKIGIIENNNIATTKQEDPHAGMVYNPISDTWSWL